MLAVYQVNAPTDASGEPLFRDRSPRRSSANAAHGGLEPPPAGRLRRANLHLSHSIENEERCLRHWFTPLLSFVAHRSPGLSGSSLGQQGVIWLETHWVSSPLSREITQRELRNESGEIMRRLDEGDSFIVARNGVRVGALSPLRRHRFVRADAAFALFQHAPALGAAKFREDVDRVGSQESAPHG